jgi:hypothetical protein
MAEMGRRLGCEAQLVIEWESGAKPLPQAALIQLHYLQNQVESYSETIQQKPQVEKELESRHMSQLTHRDLLKDL